MVEKPIVAGLFVSSLAIKPWGGRGVDCQNDKSQGKSNGTIKRQQFRWHRRAGGKIPGTRAMFQNQPFLSPGREA
jgi:hypothetical protein